MKKCENCNKEHDGSYGSGRFCSSKCSRGFSTKEKRVEINKQVSKKIQGRIYKIPSNLCLYCNTQTHTKFCSINCYKEYHKMIRTAYDNYRIKCLFKFNVYEYPDYFDLNLIEKYGWYSPTNKNDNLDGISRDHLISVKDGFINNIDPDFISHPANCKLVKHLDNQKKYFYSSITLEELKNRIESFNALMV